MTSDGKLTWRPEYSTGLTRGVACQRTLGASQPRADNQRGASQPRPFSDHAPQATIIKVSVGEFDNNSYLIGCPTTGDAILIDAAADPELLTELITTSDFTLAAILTTHQHWDHWQALAALQQKFQVPSIATATDATGIDAPVTATVNDGDTLTVGDVTLRLITLVGHTPGGVAAELRVGDGTHLFTGDSLFPGGVGKTQTPEDFSSLLGDVTSKLFDTHDDATIVYPGHGDDTTLGAERPHLSEWKERGW